MSAGNEVEDLGNRGTMRMDGILVLKTFCSENPAKR